MAKLIEYITTSKMCNYKRPDKPIEEWIDTDFFYDSYYITINTPTQLQALLIMCNQNTFSMNYFKRLAKEFNSKFK